MKRADNWFNYSTTMNADALREIMDQMTGGSGAGWRTAYSSWRDMDAGSGRGPNIPHPKSRTGIRDVLRKFTETKDWNDCGQRLQEYKVKGIDADTLMVAAMQSWIRCHPIASDNDNLGTVHPLYPTELARLVRVEREAG